MRSPNYAGLVLLAALTLGACSGGSDEASPTTTTSTPTTGPDIELPTVMAPLPRPGQPLADGAHIVYITTVTDDQLTVDVIQWLDSDEAAAVWRAETGNEGEAPYDYLIRNASTELRALPVADDVAVSLAWNPDGQRPPHQHPADYADLAAAVAKYQDPFRITVADGTITAVDELYVP